MKIDRIKNFFASIDNNPILLGATLVISALALVFVDLGEFKPAFVYGLLGSGIFIAMGGKASAFYREFAYDNRRLIAKAAQAAIDLGEQVSKYNLEDRVEAKAIEGLKAYLETIKPGQPVGIKDILAALVIKEAI